MLVTDPAAQAPRQASVRLILDVRQNKMLRIPKVDWDQVHDPACEIANSSSQEDDVLTASKTEALLHLLKELQTKYGICSRITATIADYTEKNPEALYREALRQAKAEGDIENERLILDSLKDLQK
jgi:hypothetical protein